MSLALGVAPRRLAEAALAKLVNRLLQNVDLADDARPVAAPELSQHLAQILILLGR
ncbi:MAG: hypothetical protein ACR2NV_03205 [Thermoleophilaceae bacterium]